MIRAAQINCQWWARRRVSAVVVFLALLGVHLIGCAAPIIPATNIVVDADVRDCSTDIMNALGPLDVAIVIDVSQSTRRPSGYDIDRDGSIYSFHRDNAIDRGDSRLAAQIAGVRSLFHLAQGRDIRFSIVTYSGSSIERSSGLAQLAGSVRDSRIRASLSDDLLKLDSVVSEVLEAGSEGKTLFSAGMKRAIQSLFPSGAQPPEQGSPERRRKVVLLMSDAGMSNGVDLDGNIERRDPRMKLAAIVARHRGVVFHTFGISRNAGSWRWKSLGQIAGATGGTYHPIEDPQHLDCHLADSLSPPYRRAQRGWQDAFATFREREAARKQRP